MKQVTQKKLDDSFSKMTLSLSGYRKVFALSGDKEEKTRDISDEDKLIVLACAKAYISALELKPGDMVFLSQDARPTGDEICRVVYKCLTHYDIKVYYAGVCSAPEAFAESNYKPYKCFIYVSASHNPIGYNGIKAGICGAVFGKEMSDKVIAELKKEVLNADNLIDEYNRIEHLKCEKNTELKSDCLKNYTSFVEETFRDAFPGGFDEFKNMVKNLNVGIVADLNGSARCESIDKKFLTDLGIKTAFINDTAGLVAHGIVPEGDNLEPCRALLEKMHKCDPSYQLGYMPDNDGDRGNLVYIDSDGKAKILKAQDVFALCVRSLLSVYRKDKTAVVVNCCTSMRIEDIATSFNAKVYRTEVGEPNVVEKAEKLRDEGFFVPVLGEGSNGGNIVNPAKVRDPVNTILCMMILLQSAPLYKAIETLPKYVTTDAYFEDGVMHLWNIDFNRLKKQYLKNFDDEWQAHKKELEDFGVSSYTVVRTFRFVESVINMAELSQIIKNENLSGSIKVIFTNKAGDRIAYIWLRPSGTEPLLRVLADVKGGDKKAEEMHSFLLKWQREMISKATESM